MHILQAYDIVQFCECNCVSLILWRLSVTSVLFDMITRAKMV